jgi:ribonuclease Z
VNRETLLLLAVLASPLGAQEVPRTEVVLLGTGMPRPNPAAAGPATAVVVGDRVFLFDAGRAVLQQLAAAHLPIRGPTATFLTHLHSDHTVGLPDLILTSWVMGRTIPMPIHGPPGTARMIDLVLQAWSIDIRVRTEGLEHQTPGTERVAAHEITPGMVYDSAGVRITAFHVPHGTLPESFGYRIETPDRVVVISGDTGPSVAVEAAARGADVLVHEAYPAVRLAPEDRPGGEDWPAYMRSFHTSDEELGALAARAGVPLVILTHLVRMGGTDEELLAGVRRGGYTGRVVVGHDLERW